MMVDLPLRGFATAEQTDGCLSKYPTRRETHASITSNFPKQNEEKHK
jgi:hypothetical protein